MASRGSAVRTTEALIVSGRSEAASSWSGMGAATAVAEAVAGGVAGAGAGAVEVMVAFLERAGSERVLGAVGEVELELVLELENGFGLMGLDIAWAGDGDGGCWRRGDEERVEVWEVDASRPARLRNRCCWTDPYEALV